MDYLKCVEVYAVEGGYIEDCSCIIVREGPLWMGPILNYFVEALAFIQLRKNVIEQIICIADVAAADVVSYHSNLS